MVGTVESGARSESVESVLETPGRRVEWGGGEDEGIAVDDVGMSGVGYFWCMLSHLEGDSRAMRLAGRGSVGEGKGSKAGSREGAGRLTPATGGTEDLWLLEEESTPVVSNAMLAEMLCSRLDWVEKRERGGRSSS
ncbi:MAG: hypothetical protein Q9166_005162 [cf. Caloplaca sp. 2 TL-2023]